MKKYYILLIIGLFLANSVHASEHIKQTNPIKSLFLKKTQSSQTIENNSDKNTEEDNLSADAMILYNANDIEGALKIIKDIPEDKKTALDWLLEGNIYQDKKDNEKAAICYNNSIIKDEKFYRAYYNLANMYLEDENSQEAVKLYKLSIKYKPDFGYAHYNLGCAYIKLGKLKNAKSSFSKAIEHKNDLINAYYNLAFVYKKLNNNKKAEEYLKIYNELTARKL